MGRKEGAHKGQTSCAPDDLSRPAVIISFMAMLPPLHDRLYLARRAAHLGRLGDHRMTPEAAERAIAAWEVGAASRGLSRDDPTYWDTGEAWVLERRLR